MDMNDDEMKGLRSYNRFLACVAATAFVAGATSGAGGTIAFTVFGPQVSAPSVCTTGGTAVGSAVTVTGNATYNPSAGFTPSAAGNYWWYAAYSGDANNNAAASTCGAGMAQTVVAAAAGNKLVFTTAPLSGAASSSATLGPATVQIQDQFGNPVTVASATVQLSSSSTGGWCRRLTCGGCLRSTCGRCRRSTCERSSCALRRPSSDGRWFA